MWVQLKLQQPLIHRTPNRKLYSLNPETHYFMGPALQNINTSGGPLLLCKPTVVVCTHTLSALISAFVSRIQRSEADCPINTLSEERGAIRIQLLSVCRE